MRALIGRYLEYLKDERLVSAHTLRAYGSDLDRFLQFLERDFLARDGDRIAAEEIDSLAIRSFIAALARDGVGKRSQARCLSALRGLFRFACREGTLSTNPQSLIPNPSPTQWHGGLTPETP